MREMKTKKGFVLISNEWLVIGLTLLVLIAGAIIIVFSILK